MKAVALTRYADIDHPESVFDTELPAPPAPKGRDLLVSVKAVSVNQLDNRVRRPKEKIEANPRVIGFDAAGVVAAVGPEVTLFRPATRCTTPATRRDLGRTRSSSWSTSASLATCRRR